MSGHLHLVSRGDGEWTYGLLRNIRVDAGLNTDGIGWRNHWDGDIEWQDQLDAGLGYAFIPSPVSSKSRPGDPWTTGPGESGFVEHRRDRVARRIIALR